MPDFGLDTKEKVEVVATVTTVENGASATKGTPFLEVSFDLDEALPGGTSRGSKRFYLGNVDQEGIGRIRRQLGYIGIDYKLLRPEQWDDDDYLTGLASGKRCRVQFEKDKKYGWQGAWINPLTKPKKGAAASLIGVGATLFPEEQKAPASGPPPQANGPDSGIDEDIGF